MMDPKPSSRRVGHTPDHELVDDVVRVDATAHLGGLQIDKYVVVVVNRMRIGV